MSLFRLSIAASLAGSLFFAGCGFQLQGSGGLPPAMESMYLDFEVDARPLREALQETLPQAGVRLAGSAASAASVLKVTRAELGQRVLSASASARPEEFEAFYIVTFAQYLGEVEIIAPQTITLTRDYSFDERLVLSKAAEGEQIRDQLVNDMSTAILRRLVAAR